jgi:hypothetical protein
MELPPNFQFSQGSLQDFVDCPRRFHLKYVEKLAWPALESEPAVESENYAQQGASFHRLVQQYLIGMPIDMLSRLAEADANLIRWWRNFLSSSEKLDGLANHPDINRYPEISLIAPISANQLIGKFDLLVISEDQFIIYDWKTTRKFPKREWMEANLQTRVYPYLLVLAGAYLNNNLNIKPSQIKMVYWYANFPTSPLQFLFSENQLREDQRYINNLIEEIQILDASTAKMTNNVKHCRFCVYRSLCNRGTKAGIFDDMDNEEDQDLGDFGLDFEQIAEIEY